MHLCILVIAKRSLQLFNLDTAYLYKLNSLPRGSNSSTPITNSCAAPYRTVGIDFNSNCLICTCDGWLPVPVGKVQDFNSFEEVWNSPIAKILQNDIDQKKFTWCAVDHCGIKTHNIVLPKYTLQLNIDESCNLACPSCRRTAIMHSSGEEFNNKVENVKRILQWLEKFEEPILITMSGNGDPFASHIIRPLVQSYVPKPTQQFRIRTNGLLLKKQLQTSSLFNNIYELSISIDAGSKEVYEDVRRPGKWDLLLENLDYVVDANKASITQLHFCLQQKNYRDLPNFVKLCQAYGFTGHVSDLLDWGTWVNQPVPVPDAWTIANGTFQDHNVLNPEHPDHQECLSILRELENSKGINFTFVVKNLLTKGYQ